MMKKTISAITVIFCLLPLIGRSAAFAQPKIVFEDEAHDFGDIVDGDKPEHLFSFRNEGADVLIINGVVPS
jgi:hypothetical protein